MAIEITKSTYAPYEDKMGKYLSNLTENLTYIRAGRANPRLLDRIMVDYYSSMTPINQLANIQVPEARQLLITPWDAGVLKNIEKAIYDSDLGLPPSSDGKSIRLTFPALTEDRRKDLAKEVDKYGEEAKINVRAVRRDFLDLMRKNMKNGEISEDVYKGCEEDIQKLLNKYIDKIDAAVKAKSAELMEI